MCTCMCHCDVDCWQEYVKILVSHSNKTRYLQIWFGYSRCYYGCSTKSSKPFHCTSRHFVLVIHCLVSWVSSNHDHVCTYLIQCTATILWINLGINIKHLPSPLHGSHAVVPASCFMFHASYFTSTPCFVLHASYFMFHQYSMLHASCFMLHAPCFIWWRRTEPVLV